MTISPLPPGTTTLYGPNGALLAGGTITSYTPRTTSPKSLWGNPAQTGGILANPLTLGASASAILYGFGSIRVIVKDSSGNTISDSPTFGGQVPTTTIVLNTADGGVWTPPPGVYSVLVQAVGGGGGGANALAAASRSGVSGGGGGAGGYAEGQYAVTPGQGISYSVGAGGTAEQDGGMTSFGTFLTCTGGSGANFSTIATSVGGAGGTATGGTIMNISGGNGTDGSHLPASGTTVYEGPGNGGSSYYGQGGTSVNGASGNSGTAPGSGGGGSMDVNLTNILFPGGTGAPGQLIISYQG